MDNTNISKNKFLNNKQKYILSLNKKITKSKLNIQSLTTYPNIFNTAKTIRIIQTKFTDQNYLNTNLTIPTGIPLSPEPPPPQGEGG